MGVFERIAKFVGSASALQEQAADALLSSYGAAVYNTQLLRRLVALAPQPASAVALSELAESEEAVSQRLLQALHAIGRTPPRQPATTEVPPSSHWGRLVQVLEAERRLVQALREAAGELSSALPATAQLFDELRKTESMHCERLRALIARADPQAAD